MQVLEGARGRIASKSSMDACYIRPPLDALSLFAHCQSISSPHCHSHDDRGIHRFLLFAKNHITTKFLENDLEIGIATKSIKQL